MTPLGKSPANKSRLSLMHGSANNKHAALRLMASGRATIAEVANMIGITRQSVRQWAVDANLNVTEARQAFLVKLWQRTQRAK